MDETTTKCMKATKKVSTEKHDVIKTDVSAYNQARNVQQEICFLIALLDKSSSFYNSTIQDKLTTDILPFFDTIRLEIADEIAHYIGKHSKDVTPYYS